MSRQLLSLLHLSDLSLPIGGFAHSSGLETYVQQGIVHDDETAKLFITAMISRNLHYTDAAFLSLAFDAVQNVDVLKQLDEWCSACKLPMEMRNASQKLGIRLMKIFATMYDSPALSAYYSAQKDGQVAGHYCIAFALCAQAMGIAKQDALTGFYYNATAGLVTNAVKLIPLSQLIGQQLLMGLQSMIAVLAVENLQPNKDKIGLCCPGFDLRSMQHEQLYSRLYMS